MTFTWYIVGFPKFLLQKRVPVSKFFTLCSSESPVEKRKIQSRELSLKKLRQINNLVIYLLKPLISRNFCDKSEREFLQFSHSHIKWFSVKSTL